MAGSIVTNYGSYSFISLTGDPVGPGIELLDISRPNLDGVRWISRGRRAAPFEAFGIVDIASGGFDEAALRAGYPLNQGRFAEVEFDGGLTLSDYLVLRVDILPVEAVGNYVGGVSYADGSNGDLLYSIWRLQYPYGF